jgi:hypothetical protein
MDWDGNPIVGRGVVFFNPDDRCYQAAHGDGHEVVIFSPITPGQAARLAAKAASFAADPNNMALAEFKAVLHFARYDLRIHAMYNSTQHAVAGTMSRAGPNVGIAGYGLFRRDREDLCLAVFVPGEGVFVGPAATPQQFDHGAVIVSLGDDIRLVQPPAFEATYKHADGRPLKVSELAVQSP